MLKFIVDKQRLQADQNFKSYQKTVFVLFTPSVG